MTRLLWVVLGAGVVGSGVLIGARTARRHEHPGVTAFALLSVLFGALGATIAFTRAGFAPIDLDAASQLLLIGGNVFASLLWIGFVFEYTGRGPTITPRRWIGLALLGVLTIASMTVSWAQQTGRVELAILGQLSYLTTFVLQVTVFSLGLLGVVLLVRSSVTYDDLPLGSAAAFTVAGIGITFLPLAVVYGEQWSGASMQQVIFVQIAVVVGVFAWIQFGTDAFERGASAGHLARETALDAMSVPVVVVDRSGGLLDVNQAAEETFAIDTARYREQSLDDIGDIPEDPSAGESVALRTTVGRREFVVERSEITDADGNALGRAYRFREVTDRETRKQRIQVLNRVIRHNLRNDLDAIRGFAEPIRDEVLPADETTQYFDRIETLATGLVELAGAVERSERVLTETRLAREPCDLVGIARQVADEQTAAEIRLETPDDDVELQSDRDAVRLILAELVDNAVTHTDQETPSVTISVRSTTAGGRIEVRDDGPGIPAQERAVFLEEEETPLKHGSGVGLWLVYWAVTRLGGDLSFADNEPRGSSVIVDLPEFGTP